MEIDTTAPKALEGEYISILELIVLEFLCFLWNVFQNSDSHLHVASS